MVRNLTNSAKNNNTVELLLIYYHLNTIGIPSVVDDFRNLFSYITRLLKREIIAWFSPERR